MIDILIAIIAGCILGTFTGVIPGLHINSVALMIMYLSSFLLSFFSADYLAITIVSMAVTHTFLDIIPSTFLGLPSEDTIAEALPAHKMTMEGRAMEAIIISAFGAFSGLIMIILISPLLLKYIKVSYTFISPFIGIILVLICVFCLLRSKNIFYSSFVFLLSGLVGVVVLNTKVINQPLLPLLSGLFGISSLILSIGYKTSIPKQLSKVEVNIKNLRIPINTISSLGTNILTSFLPGLTAAHTNALSSSIIKQKNHGEYLFVNGSIGTVSMFISIVAVYIINKSRNGAIIVLSNLTMIDAELFWILIFSSLVSCFFAMLILFKLSGFFCNIFMKVKYNTLCLSIIVFNIILIILFSGWLGILVLITAAAFGIFSILLGVDRMHMMGVLAVPVILFFI